jgi:peptidoglycan/LPS O-acetylase OafA/YrhL
VTGGVTKARVPATLARWFSQPWLRSIGKYSYGIYVFQTPVRLMLYSAAAGRLATGSASARFGALVAFVTAVFTISMLLALVSWHLLEKPMLGFKRYFQMERRAA